MSPSPRFSIVVPTYDRPRALERMLDAIGALERPEGGFELIVVDDGGGEGVDDVVARCGSRFSARLLRVDHGGPAAARQAGIDVAAGRYLAFTDDDCLPAKGWLAALSRAFEVRPSGTAYGGRVVNGLEANRCAEASQQIVTHMCAEGRLSSPRFFTTNNVAFPADEFRSIGGLDRSWTISGGEDRDLCERWQREGFALEYLPDALVVHEHALGLGQFVRQHFHYGRGSWRFRKDGNRPIPLSSVGDYARLVGSGWGTRRGLGDGIAVTSLIALAQIANATGFAVEGLRSARRG